MPTDCNTTIHVNRNGWNLDYRTTPTDALEITSLTYDVNGAPQAVATRMKPVSYTHLRAHETVLDLVCRLLLEKKKKTKSHSTITYLKQDRDTSDHIHTRLPPTHHISVATPIS